MSHRVRKGPAAEHAAGPGRLGELASMAARRHLHGQEDGDIVKGLDCDAGGEVDEEAG